MGLRSAGYRIGEQIALIGSAVMLILPTSLVLFFAQVIWRDSFWAGTVLLGALTVAPLTVIWLVQQRVSKREKRLGAGRHSR